MSIQYCLVFLLFMGAVAYADNVDDEWNNFKIRYDKLYPATEAKHRFEIFKKNFQFIKSQNENSENTFKVELNHLADLDDSDLILTGSKEPSFWSYIKNLFSSKIIAHQKPKFNESAKVPPSVDWRNRIRVSEVGDQQVGKNCDSSYAFAAISTLEAYHTMRTGHVLDLSEQEVIDCSELNFGCIGGNDIFTFNYLIENGVAAKKDFPYKADQNDCPKDKPTRSGVKVYGYAEANGEEELKKALDQFGPVSVDVSIPSGYFQFYKHGILSVKSCNDAKKTSEVVLFGYGHDNATKLDYWIIRNSWSKSWGENGYMRLERGPGSCLKHGKGFFPLLDEAAAADNLTADMAQFGIGIIAVIAIAITLFCCGCCLCICCIKWCIGLCCD